ncbi:CYTH domain protein [compost metagenome]
MPVEIERKFLVKDPSVVQGVPGTRVRQGYLADNGMCVRVRVTGTDGMPGNKGWLTLKGTAAGMSRPEFEYEIPLADALELLEHHSDLGRVFKTRHILAIGGGRKWEIDVYDGPLQGLMTAEIELSSEDEQVELPDWVGAEVTHDRRFSNASLAAAGSIPQVQD